MRLRGPLAGEIRARTLHGLVVGLLLYIWIVHIPVIVPLFAARKAGSTLANLYLTLIYGITLALLRRGSLRRASLVFLAGTWVAATVFIVLGGGVQSTALVHYVNLPILAAWLLGAPAAGMMTAVCLGGSLLLAVLEQSGYVLPHYFPGAPFGNWSSVAMATLGTVVPVLYVLSALNEALEGRKGAEDGLRQANEKLEQRVRERTAQLEEANDFLQIHVEEQKRLEAGLELAARFPGENPNPVMRLGQGHLVDFANPAAQALLRMLGCAVVGEAPAHIAEPAVSALKDGVPRQIEKTYSDRTYLFSLSPILQAGYVNLYAIDITDRKQAEEALKASEQRFRGLSEAMPQIVWTAQATGARDYYNPRAFEYAGASRSDLDGWNWTSIVHSNDLEATLDTWGHAIATGQIYEIAHRLRRADGAFRWHLTRAVPLRNDKGEVIQWIGTATDIHDQKMAEQELERRVAERTAELAQSTALLETVTANAPVVLFATDANGTFTVHTGQAVTASDRKPGEFVGKNCRELLPERARTVEQIHRALAGETFTAVLEDPHDSTFETRYNPLRDAKGNITGMIAVAVDITERTRAEEALKAERQRFFAVLETLPPMICLLTPDYHVAFANRAFRERFGESQGRRCYDYCFGRPSPCEFCETYNVLKTGQPHHWEVNTPDGSVIDAYDFPFTDVDGTPMILEMDIDITEAKRAKEGLEKANAYNRSLLEASLDPLVTISPNGKITDVNSAAEKVTGHLREELIGADFSDYFTDPEKARLGYQQVFKEGLVQDYELEVRHRDGSTTPVLYNASVYRDQGGEVVGVFAAARDITTRKRAEEEVRRLNEELEQRVRLRTAQLEASNKGLESFSYSVSHDLRAPLRAMDGFSRILLEEYRSQLPSEAQRYLDFVRDGAYHMGNLIDGLLALSRLGRQELKRSPVEVAEIVRQSMGDLQADVEGSAAEFVVGSLPSCDADPLLLRQVFVNLLSNALKFSRKQEKVRIEIGALRTREAAQGREPVLRLLDPDSWVYYVRDNGVGFDMRYAHKLFGLFQRLHGQEEFKGTGIGLATVQQIIHRHGGQVWAEAEAGKGATFFFTIGPSQDLASG